MPRHIYSRGCQYGEKGDRDRMIADFTEAIRLNPKLRQAFSARARSTLAFGEFDKAIADFNEAAKLDPQRAECIVGGVGPTIEGRV